MKAVTEPAAIPFFGRIGTPIGLQLYTLGEEASTDFDTVFARLAAIGYRDIELPGLGGQAASVVRAAADNAGLRISSIHLSPPGFLPPDQLSFASPAAQISDLFGIVGADAAILPIAPLPAGFTPTAGEDPKALFASALAQGGADHWKAIAEMLNEKASSLKPLDIRTGYHNHNVEFVRIGEVTGWDVLVANTDPDLVAFEVDLGWIGAAGLDPARFLEEHVGRVGWVHLKDIKASTLTNCSMTMDPVEVGDGVQDWRSILLAAEKAGVRRYYVEQEPPFEMPRWDSISRSHAYLSALRA